MTEPRTTTDRAAPVARRVISPALFAVVVICFFLPFVTISCNEAGAGFAEGLAEGLGEELGGATGGATEDLEETFTGIDLVTGSTGEEVAEGAATLPGQEGVETGQVKDSQPFAIAAIVVAVLGMALSWLALWIGPVAGSALGIGGIVALFLLKGKVEGVLPAGGELDLFISFQWQLGYWLAMAAFGLAAAWSIFRLLTEARWATARAGPSGPVASTQPARPAPPPPPD